MSDASPQNQQDETAAVPLRSTFNLITEPWIQVRTHNGEVAEVSILDAFSRAREIKDICGELPTQTFAITRLLLAILYRVYGEELSVLDWQDLWKNGPPSEDIAEYLADYDDRFDLLHAETPFFQVADLKTAKDEVKDVVQLLFDVPSNQRLFTTRAGEGVKRLNFAEAARWLVSVQAFDPSGNKSGAVGDQRVRAGKGYPIGVAWSGQLGGVLLEGTDLAETLALNFVLSNENYAIEWEDDLPPWERKHLGPAEAPARHVAGPVDLYTWQSRRVRLVHDGRGIYGSLIANGDRITPQNRHRHEMMSAWRYSQPQTKKLGHTTYMPKEYVQDRAFWRGLSALLPKAQLITEGKEASRYLPPGSIMWLSQLQMNETIPGSTQIGVRAIGVIYGSNNSVVDDVIDDRLLVSLALLRADNSELAARAEDAVMIAESGVQALWRLAGNLAIAAGGEGASQQSRAQVSAYAALDQPYRTWLAGLGPETEPVRAIEEWKTTAREIIRAIGLELIDTGGPTAWIGREHRGELMTSSRAAHYFTRSLWKIFGDPKMSDTSETAKEGAA
ncbi:type I-E CRISPR-associated protein Cse1/CasA [Saxibacter everestensis]|uniref:Type I-E CRISPR-associated protein Cse1/CasA n=1 Tax=Saxibacter everestensis TaxID=2909229 RepID=A0ABY8QSZ3_9MICO|nr:type I-E CRISPR-associated protein Cse1/CasA [Brevibacteriaceae bacterium ZFBP1038]